MSLFRKDLKKGAKNVLKKGWRYYEDQREASNYIDSIINGKWEVLRFTPSRNNEDHDEYSDFRAKNSHKVIGQEFDYVAVIIDENFEYDVKGNLTYRSYTYYQAVKMLFQNVTRARKKLKIILINNPEILDRCLCIL